MSGYLTAPVHVRIVDFGHLLVLLNANTGGLNALDTDGSQIWNSLTKHSTVDKAVEELNRSRDAVESFIKPLLDGGFLVLGERVGTWPEVIAGKKSQPGWGTGTVVMALRRRLRWHSGHAH